MPSPRSRSPTPSCGPPAVTRVGFLLPTRQRHHERSRHRTAVLAVDDFADIRDERFARFIRPITCDSRVRAHQVRVRGRRVRLVPAISMQGDVVEQAARLHVVVLLRHDVLAGRRAGCSSSGKYFCRPAARDRRSRGRRRRRSGSSSRLPIAPPGRSTSRDFTKRTAGSIQWNAVNDVTRSNAPGCERCVFEWGVDHLKRCACELASQERRHLRLRSRPR